MIMQVPVRSLTSLRGVGIGETEQFLLQTLVGGAASFGGGFFGARTGAASGSQTPALQALAAGAAGPTGVPGIESITLAPPTAAQQREAAARAAAAAAAAKKKRDTLIKVGIGVGAVAALGTAVFLLRRRAG